MAFWIPLIAGAVGGLGLGTGASDGGLDFFSGVEIGTKKEQTTQTFQETYNVSPTITRTYDVQYNIASDGSNITTKKEQAISQEPQTTTSPYVIPLQMQGAGASPSTPIGSSASGSGGINIAQIIIFSGIGLGAYYLIKGGKK